MSDALEAEESEADLREHLRRIDEEIEELRQELDRLREDRQDREDWEDGSTATRLLEEQER
jgi:prefoldin subunit 5